MAARWQRWMPIEIDQLWGSASVQQMSAEAFRGYFALLTAQWQSEDGTLSNDEKALWKASRLSREAWERESETILDNFTRVDGDRIRNRVCHEKWLEACRVHIAKSSARKKTNAEVNEDSSMSHARVLDESSKTQDTNTNTDTDTEKVSISDSSNEESSPRAQGSGKTNHAEAIYQAYPRHVGKAAALKAIKRAIKAAQSRTDGRNARDAAAWLYRVTVAFARSPAGNRGELTPHPATWFNQGRYDDNPTEWQEQISDGARKQSGGFVRTKTERNLDALREAIGLTPPMDMRAIDGNGECTAGDDFGGGFAPVLDGITGTRQGGHCVGGSGDMPVRTQ